MLILLIVVLACVNIWQRLKLPPELPNPMNLEAGSSGKLFVHPELSESTKKRMGLIGPFPVSEDIPELERRIGRAMNVWRQAIIIKSIKDIERLGLEIKRYKQDTVPFLRKLVLEDENERVRAFATRALGRMARSDLNSLFMGLLQNDTSKFVRENAAWSLGKTGNANTVSLLEKIVSQDESERVRQVAQESIENINQNNPKEETYE